MSFPLYIRGNDVPYNNNLGRKKKERYVMKKNLVVMVVVWLICVSFAWSSELLPPYKYQLEPYQAWINAGYTTNYNCGPACNAMVIGCFLGKDISTALYSSPQNAQGVGCMTESRWLYCEANGLPGGYTNTDMEYNGSDRMIKVLNFVGLSTELVTGSNVTLERIKRAIDQKCLVICHVSPKEYYKCSLTSHWALAYNYDATSVVIHDPGYHSIQYKQIVNSQFVNALEHAGGGNDKIIIIVSNHNQPSVGHCQDNTICQPILDCYNTNGGLQTFGNPMAITFDGLSQPATVWPYWSCYLQVFNGGDLGECAIVYDYRASPAQAFVLQNKLWYYYQAHSGPFMLLDGNYLGGPVGPEVYATNNHNGHQMSVQRMAHGYLVYDPVTAFTDAVTDSSSFTIADVGGPDFTMAIIPGSTSQLVLTATALSCSTVQLAFNDVGASEYWVYQNGQYRLAIDSLI